MGTRRPPFPSMSPILLLQASPLGGAVGGSVRSCRALSRKSSRFLAKTGHLFWKTLCVLTLTQVSFLSYLTLPLGWEGAQIGDTVLLHAAWGLRFSLSTGAADIFKPEEQSKFGLR